MKTTRAKLAAIGDIVHAVIKNADELLVTRPAIVTQVWGGEPYTLNATVFPDAANDGLGDTEGKEVLWYDREGTKENTWRWPKREK